MRDREPARSSGARWLAPARRLALRNLKVNPGQTVVDVACGNGLNLAALSAAAGRTGRVIAVERRPEQLGQVAQRIRDHDLGNVELIEASVEEALLPARVDRVLFCFANEVLRSREAVERVVRCLAPAGRVSATGAMRGPRWFPGTDPLARRALRRSASTPDGLEEPWSLLAGQLPELRVERMYLGAVFVAWGQLP